MTGEQYELYREEVLELTNLVNNQWLQLKEVIESKGIRLSESLLVSYKEDEEGGEYGILVVSNSEIFNFHLAEGEIVTFENVAGDKEVEREYPQIAVALDLIDSGNRV